VDCAEPLQRLIEVVGLTEILDFCSRGELAERFPEPLAPSGAQQAARGR
jgi:hypothetical protein